MANFDTIIIGEAVSHMSNPELKFAVVDKNEEKREIYIEYIQVGGTTGIALNGKWVNPTGFERI